MKLHREMAWAEEESIKSQIRSYFLFSKIAELLENVLPEFLPLSHKRLKGCFCHPCSMDTQLCEDNNLI